MSTAYGAALNDSFVARYTKALRRYCSEPSEAGLQVAYELGREASGEVGCGMIALLDIHNKAVETLIESSSDISFIRLAMLRAAGFLTEVMPHFEMKLRGFQEANHRLRQRTHELAHLQEQALLASQAKSRFLSHMSHELRTPLNSILGFSEVLSSGLAGEVNDEQSRQLQMVRDAAQHLLSLVNDLLDLGRIEAGRVVARLESFSLEELLENVMRTVQPLADKKHLRLERHADCADVIMHSDQRLLRQVMLNLLNNAIKFTEKGQVTLSCNVDRSVVTVVVEDTGPGMAPEQLKRLFTPFEQVHRDDQRAGTGLGLYLSQVFIEQLRGDISVSSEVGKGSRFTVTVPLDSASQSEAQSA
jgi:signal transduction histidine kinase